MWNNIYKVIVGVFIVFWVGFVFLDYWQNHLQYIIAFHVGQWLECFSVGFADYFVECIHVSAQGDECGFSCANGYVAIEC